MPIAGPSDMETSDLPPKRTYLSESQTPDLEAEFRDHDPKAWSNRTERTELTPVEAFKWNVDGDQSPCRDIYIRIIEARIADEP
jgi:hypothetical protein